MESFFNQNILLFSIALNFTKFHQRSFYEGVLKQLYEILGKYPQKKYVVKFPFEEIEQKYSLLQDQRVHYRLLCKTVPFSLRLQACYPEFPASTKKDVSPYHQRKIFPVIVFWNNFARKKSVLT